MTRFFVTIHLLASALLLTALFLTKSGFAADPNHGKELYKTYCSQCHGVEGDGYGINAPFMDVQPKDHTEAKEMNARTDQDLFKAIKSGGKAVSKSVLMPAWGSNLSDEEITALVVYLRELSAP